MKYLIFDSGPLINFSMNGMLELFEKIKKEFSGEFLITKEVKREIIDHPQTIKRFQLGALRLQDLFDREVIKHADITSSQVDELRIMRDKLMSIANSTFKARGKHLHLIDKGEAAALALSSMMNNKNPAIVIDERTTRMLCENPDNLKKLLQKKLKSPISANTQNYKFFKNFRIIRSTELIYIAHKRELIKAANPQKMYEAMLYGIKYKGCSVSEEEIDILKGL
jgi:hypothetical protein